MPGELSHERLFPDFGIVIYARAQDILLDAALREQFTRLFFEHQMVLLPGQSLTASEQRDLVALLGDVLEDSAYISNDPSRGVGGTAELLFHSDFSYFTFPLSGISLFAEQVAPGSAGTSFASTRNAAARLPESLRGRLQNRSALHLYEPSAAGSRRLSADDATSQGTGAVRPVLYRHPRTGDEVLYASELATALVLGLDTATSDALLAEAFSYLYEPSAVFTHEWTEGDLLVWDNIALQHARAALSSHDVAPRHLRRFVFGRAAFPSHASVLQRG